MAPTEGNKNTKLHNNEMQKCRYVLPWCLFVCLFFAWDGYTAITVLSARQRGCILRIQQPHQLHLGIKIDAIFCINTACSPQPVSDRSSSNEVWISVKMAA